MQSLTTTNIRPPERKRGGDLEISFNPLVDGRAGRARSVDRNETKFMMVMWDKFNADRPDPKIENMISEERDKLFMMYGEDEVAEVKRRTLEEYESGRANFLNRCIAINIFKPEEFDHITDDNKALKDLLRWVAESEIDWRNRSDNISVRIRRYFEKCAEGRMVKGARDNLELDANVLIKGRRVAIEVEVSNNIDNGIYTLRHAIAQKISDCGVLIVPWSARRSGQADEGKATGRIDREFHGSTESRFGPVYRLAVVRTLDVWLRI